MPTENFDKLAAKCQQETAEARARAEEGKRRRSQAKAKEEARQTAAEKEAERAITEDAYRLQLESAAKSLKDAEEADMEMIAAAEKAKAAAMLDWYQKMCWSETAKMRGSDVGSSLECGPSQDNGQRHQPTSALGSSNLGN